MDNKCRACLTSVPRINYYSLLTVFPEFKRKSLTVLDLLSTVTSSQVDLNERLPSKICDRCFQTLKQAYGFIVAFKNSQNLLSKGTTIHQIKNLPNITIKRTPDLIEENIIIITEEEYQEDVLDKSENNKEIENLKLARSYSLITDGNVSDEYSEKIEENDSEQEDMLDENDMMYQLKEELDSTISEQSIMEDVTTDNDTNEDINQMKQTIKSNSFKSNRKQPLYKCEICGKEYYFPKNFFKHMNSKHSNLTEGNKVYKCATCDKVFSSEKQLKMHEYNFHHPDSNEKYKCKICNELFNSSKAVSYHKLAKHVGKKFPCSICNKQFIGPSNVKAHIMTVHEKKIPEKFLCSVCGKRFKYSSAIKYHMAYEHTKKKDFVCSFCGMSFVLEGALRNHEKTHTDERPHKCKYCYRSFIRSSEKKRHQDTHLGIYPHKCKYCNKEFTSKYNMHDHWRQHFGKFKCDLCDKGFASTEILRFHCWSKHKRADVEINTE